MTYQWDYYMAMPVLRPLVQSADLSSIGFGYSSVTCSYVGLRPYPTLVQERFKAYNSYCGVG